MNGITWGPGQALFYLALAQVKTVFDTVIVGSGIMGLSLALEETQRGKKIALIDEARPLQNASTTAAGILTHRGARRFASVFREFQVRSIESFPGWLSFLQQETGIAIETHKGAYHLFQKDQPEEEASYQRELDKLRREDSQDYEVLEAFPFEVPFRKTGKSLRAICFPKELAVNPRHLLQALEAFCRRQGAVFLEGGVNRVVPGNSGGSASVKISQPKGTHATRDALPNAPTTTQTSEVYAEKVVIAAGAHSKVLLEGLGYTVPLSPVRGQVLLTRNFLPTQHFLHCGSDTYLVPRGDELLVGVTTEPGDWSVEPSEKSAEYIIHNLLKYFDLEDLPIIESRVGLRSKTRDRMPWIGYLDDTRQIAILTGHYKSGIGLAPLSAACLSAMLNEEAPPFDVTPFHPLRRKGLQKI